MRASQDDCDTGRLTQAISQQETGIAVSAMRLIATGQNI